MLHEPFRFRLSSLFVYIDFFYFLDLILISKTCLVRCQIPLKTCSSTSQSCVFSVLSSCPIFPIMYGILNSVVLFQLFFPDAVLSPVVLSYVSYHEGILSPVGVLGLAVLSRRSNPVCILSLVPVLFVISVWCSLFVMSYSVTVYGLVTI